MFRNNNNNNNNTRPEPSLNIAHLQRSLLHVLLSALYFPGHIGDLDSGRERGKHNAIRRPASLWGGEGRGEREKELAKGDLFEAISS